MTLLDVKNVLRNIQVHFISGATDLT